MAAHPIAFRRIWKRQVRDVKLLISNQLQHIGEPPRLTIAVAADVTWYQTGGVQNRADTDAVVARALSPAMDAAQHAGLVENDRTIHIGWIHVEQARTKADERVEITFRIAKERST
jgi:hypothetical protein